MEPFFNAGPERASHIALRTHLDVLAPQILPDDEEESQMFGVSLCAAPYMGEGTPPPLADALPLQPYLPWTWAWRDTTPDKPGFQWTLLVRMERIAAVSDWKPVPRDILRVFAQPAGWNDTLQRLDQEETQGTIHKTWWQPELARLVLSNADGQMTWKQDDPRRPPLAHAKRLDQFYTGVNEPETEVDEGAHDTHDDLLGARVLRWATANPPYNFVNRLAAVLAIPEFARLKKRMETDFAGYLLNADSAQFIAAPLWSSPDYPDQKFDGLYEGRDDFILIEQTKVPIDGVAPKAPDQLYLRRFYGQAQRPMAHAEEFRPAHQRKSAASSLTVEIEPWRADVEVRVSRCVDVPMLLLDWADAQTDDPQSFGPWVQSAPFAEWIVCLSLDLLQAFVRFPANQPPDASAALRQIRNAADLDVDATQAARLHNLALQLSDRLDGKDHPATRADRLSALRDWMQLLREQKMFAALRAHFALQGAALSAENPVGEALRQSLTLPAGDRTLGQQIIPLLKDEDSEAAVPPALIAYLRQRQLPIPKEPPTTRQPSPRVPEAAQNDEVLESFEEYLAGPRLRDLKVLIFGDFDRPLSHPHPFVLVAEREERVIVDDEPADDGDGLDEQAGALVFGRTNGTKTGSWLSLNAGVLQVRFGTEIPYRALQESHVPLRGSYLNDRRSVRADYDNRPLVAISPKRALTQVPTSELESTESSRESWREEYVWRTGSEIPALRYYPPGYTFQFLWVTLGNSCCLPEGFWRVHPAVLVPALEARLENAPGAAISAPDRYLRRVGITTPSLRPVRRMNADGSALALHGKEWPKLPEGVFPLSKEVPPLLAPADVPLVLLFPLAASAPPPSLQQPQLLVHRLVTHVSKPATSEENWERWVSADGSANGVERRTICAGAHRARDLIASGDLNPQNPPPPMWQPDDPALSNHFFIVFRRLYPWGKEARGYLRTWAPSTTGPYTAVGRHFTAPFALELIPDAAAPVWVHASPARGNSFHLQPGTLVEIAIYALLPTAEAEGRFLPDLLRPVGEQPPALGESAALPGVVFPEPFPLDFDPVNFLAVSPAFLRVETAFIRPEAPDLPPLFPSPDEAYRELRSSAQGSKVCLGISRQRPREVFDWVHEVIVQEQIWRWNGKPVLPEDFVGPDGKQLFELPKPRSDGRGLPKPEDQELTWDGVAFHHRDDIEHLGSPTVLPLVQEIVPAPQAQAVGDAGDVLYTSDRTSDLRPLYFRFSALLRSRYFGVWPRAVQAGKHQTGNSNGVDVLWERHVLSHRLATPLKKPSLALLVPLLASGQVDADAEDTAGVLAVVREAHFEQAGLAEKLECELVEVKSYRQVNGKVEPDGNVFFQAGYDPTLSTTALGSLPDPKSPEEVRFVKISGPLGLTFDQGARDPLIVNSVYSLGIQRELLSKLIEGNQQRKASASHLYCKLRFRRVVRAGYDLPSRSAAVVEVGRESIQDSLSSEWTESQWVKFLPDSDGLRPRDGASSWNIRTIRNEIVFTFKLENWALPTTPRPVRFRYLFCVTRHDLDAQGRSATEFHSLYSLAADGTLTMLRTLQGTPGLESSLRRLRGRVMEILVSADDTALAADTWIDKLFPTPTAVSASGRQTVREDAEAVIQSLSPAFPLVSAT